MGVVGRWKLVVVGVGVGVGGVGVVVGVGRWKLCLEVVIVQFVQCEQCN